MIRKTLLSGVCVAFAATSIPAFSASVYTGGICSSGNVMGMNDLVPPGNSEYIRSKGAKLYCHELAWTRSTTAGVKAAVVANFPAAPMWESSMPSTHCLSSLDNYVMPNWTMGSWCLAVNGADDATTDFQTLRNSTVGKATRIAPIMAPNSGQYVTYPWSSSRWNQYRTNCTIGRALCIDAPPPFYLSQPEGYQSFIASMITWANAQTNVISMLYLYPRDSSNYLQDTIAQLSNLNSRGAVPAMYLPTSYYSVTSSNSLAHPIGHEDGDSNQILRVARYLLDHY